MAQVRYIVNNVDQAIDFYVSHLGFTIKQRFGPVMAILERENLRLWLAGPTASASRPMPNGSRPAPGGWSRIVIVVDDIEMIVSELREKGVYFRSSIVGGPGGNQILCEDPSGNPIELFEPT
jgi:catechol 2,3-dioxygenase-like lactoylglutathione lyase family enzyme